MKLFAIVTLISLSQLGSAGEVDLNQRQISLSHNRELMDYMLKNSEDIYETIVRGGPGSTELLSQVAGTALTHQTQAWFRCSRKHGVDRNVFAENIHSYRAFTNEQELCAKSCYMEESGMVSNGKLDGNMVNLIMIMGYGDDRDIHNFTRDLVNHCNKQLPQMDHQSCKTGMYLDCFMKGCEKAKLYMPGQVLNEFRTPWIMELTSK